jgi:hypothetical protein
MNFPGKIGVFPGRYLGLPLHTRKLRKIEVQPLVEKIGARLPGWKGKFFDNGGKRDFGKNGTIIDSHLPFYGFPCTERGAQEN